MPKLCIQSFAQRNVRRLQLVKRRHKKKQEEQRQQLSEQFPTDRPYISIAEAVVLFGISRDTIYRQIRKGNIPAVNLGERLTRISRVHIEAMFPKVEIAKAIQPTITQRIEAASVDIAPNYADWRDLGFALADALGESGRN